MTQEEMDRIIELATEISAKNDEIYINEKLLKLIDPSKKYYKSITVTIYNGQSKQNIVYTDDVLMHENLPDIKPSRSVRLKMLNILENIRQTIIHLHMEELKRLNDELNELKL